MTRGKIIYIGPDMQIYSSVEFNGDMYPTEHGHGKEIIDFFQVQGFKDVYSFMRFIKRLDSRYFKYAEQYERNLVRFMGMYKEDSFDFKENYTDYIYLVNYGRTDAKIFLKEETVLVPTGAMAIVKYQSIYKIIEAAKCMNVVPLDKNEFVKIMNSLCEARDLVDKVDELFRNSRENIECDFCNAAGLQISHERIVVNLLEKLMGDRSKEISYFIYELDFGRKYEPGMVKDENGDIDFSTAEALYEHCIKTNFSKEVSGREQCEE